MDGVKLAHGKEHERHAASEEITTARIQDRRLQSAYRLPEQFYPQYLEASPGAQMAPRREAKERAKACLERSNTQLTQLHLLSRHLHKMHLRLVKEGLVALTRRFYFAISFMIIGAVAFGLVIDEVVAKVLTAAMRRSQRFASMDVRTFQQPRWRFTLTIAT